MKIDDLLTEFYGTDKAIYAAQYHALFKHIREWPRTLLEIGIGTMIPDAPENMVDYPGEGYSPGGSLRVARLTSPMPRFMASIYSLILSL